jgi:hypothetical protein
MLSIVMLNDLMLSVIELNVVVSCVDIGGTCWSVPSINKKHK